MWVKHELDMVSDFNNALHTQHTATEPKSEWAAAVKDITHLQTKYH